MKKFFILVAFAGLIALYSTAFAGSGSALIPSYETQYLVSGTKTDWSNVKLLLTNISSETIDITIWFYNNNGEGANNIIHNVSPAAILNDGGDPIGFTAPTVDGQPSATFSLLPKKNASILMYYHDMPTQYGYGLIEWSSPGNSIVALVATGINSHFYVNTGASFARGPDLTINGGKPF